MNCVRYDPETNHVLSYGTISEESFAIVTAEGRAIIAVDEFPEGFKIHLYDVNPETKTLVLSPNPRPDPSPPSEPLPERNALSPISDRQFYLKAAFEGFVSQEDALKAVQTGFIPAIIQSTIDKIENPTIKFMAEMLFSGGTTFYRPDPLVENVLLDFGLDDEEKMNGFFREAAKL